jgi:hypothetical protein
VGEGGSAVNTWKGLDRFPFAQVEFNIRALNFFPFSAYWEQNFKDAFKSTPTIRKIPLIPPLPLGEIVIPLFGKEGRGEIF